MLEAVFFILLIVVVFSLFSYIRKMTELIEYSQLKSLNIFGQQYNNIYSLYADISFLKNLFSGAKLGSVTDELLRLKLISIRKMLLLQLFIGFIVFAIVLVSGINGGRL